MWQGHRDLDIKQGFLEVVPCIGGKHLLGEKGDGAGDVRQSQWCVLGQSGVDVLGSRGEKWCVCVVRGPGRPEPCWGRGFVWRWRC